ncbi:hypothetical protein Hanom_Chr00s001035g01672401 [Helianthus anomalus]
MKHEFIFAKQMTKTLKIHKAITLPPPPACENPNVAAHISACKPQKAQPSAEVFLQHEDPAFHT